MGEEAEIYMQRKHPRKRELFAARGRAYVERQKNLLLKSADQTHIPR
jgi:hypothetical protein